MNRFKFGSINYDSKQTFCGANLTQSLDFSEVTFSLEKYLRQVKPLTLVDFLELWHGLQRRHSLTFVPQSAWRKQRCLELVLPT